MVYPKYFCIKFTMIFTCLLVFVWLDLFSEKYEIINHSVGSNV